MFKEWYANYDPHNPNVVAAVHNPGSGGPLKESAHGPSERLSACGYAAQRRSGSPAATTAPLAAAAVAAAPTRHSSSVGW